MKTTRVLLVDDFPIIRMGVRKLLEPLDWISVVGEAGDGYEALRMIEELAPDLVVLDIEMPGLNGIEIARRISEKWKAIKVLIISAHESPEYVSKVLSSGVAGYLVKDEVTEKIVEAVRGIISGSDGWLSQRVVARMIQTYQVDREKQSSLSERESQVLACIVDGQTNHEIARRLGIRETTVEKHVLAVVTKMGVRTRVEAAVAAVRQENAKHAG